MAANITVRRRSKGIRSFELWEIQRGPLYGILEEFGRCCLSTTSLCISNH